ncbi:myb family transcription factor [Fusarium austroafricanum]|uniref:Myb family transcription factor n=1 Tax=Fusarium austroafricanum TaxID=2364996 RepID=A0A8H4JPX5_9HYPO|nr:myb family transcription factor [Fusarium austroafricanum]
MPKHTRASSSSQNRYHAGIPVSLAPSPLYSQQRMSMPNYYGMGTTAASSLALQTQTQEPTYEPYASSSAPPVSVPPPPVQHRASSGAWTPQDDQQLLTARMQGLNWGQIQANYFPSKTPNACRKRHERLLERKGADDWDSLKLQRLAKEYMAMRKEIWSGLAARTGEKWNVVEAKCMSNGLKNLQSAARAAARRDRLESGALSGYDDDSGISGMGLTPVDELDASYSSPETTASSFQHLQPHHMAAAVQYSLGAPYAPGYGGHGYSSSVSSSASAGHYGHHHGGHSQGNSPQYMTQRPQSSDMGIGNLINRPGRGV